jgi:23S rRNA (guanosine2251-2'-O)-methyltransferase
MKLWVMLDRIRSAYNVGSLFRTCDSAAVDRLLLTGWCAFPPHPKLQKTALGSLDHVAWEHHCSAAAAATYIKARGIKLICCETTDAAGSLFDHHYQQDTCLVFGNEENGIDPKVLDQADQILKIPQFGIKESLNVASAAAIAIYEFRRQSGINRPQPTTLPSFTES